MNARVQLDRNFVVSDVDPRLFGGFIEHLGRAVYEGIYEPGHPDADGKGFRKDVIELVKELDMPVTRYPGGNFVSGYNWEDGIGPRDKRPKRLELAWKTIDPNWVGVDEFVDWCRKANTEPMMAVNLGTRDLEAARNILEYCNFPGGTDYSDRRKANGHEEPHGIKLWCIGNEMDGPWQIGHKTGKEYGRAALEAAKLMKWTDPSIELVVCGSSHPFMETFGTYELETLSQCFDYVDYVSTHYYCGNRSGNTAHFLSKPDEMNWQIQKVVALCDAASAIKKTRRKIHVSFDEWNVWFHSNQQDNEVPEWITPRPILEDVYTMEDALVVGGMAMALLKNADRVKIGCLAQTVNVIAPIMTAKDGPAWRQTTFYPFMHASKYGRGTVLKQVIDNPTYPNQDGIDTNYLDTVSVVNEEKEELTVFAVNRSLDSEINLAVELCNFRDYAVAECITLHHADLKAVNTCEKPEEVVPSGLDGVSISAGEITATLPPASWNVIRLKV
jgi:alpha-N-arabinofuranosidase